MEPISITIERNLADYREAYTVVTKPLQRVAIALVVLGLATWFLSIAFQSRDALLGAFGGVELSVGVWALWTAYYWAWLTPRKMYVAHRKHFPTEYKVNADGIAMKTSFGESFTKWNAFCRLKETRNLWILQFSNAVFYILPKRCAPADRVVELQTFLRSREALESKTPVRPG